MFKILTTTGGRPEAWELCKRWMRAQTRKPDAWIIVDDCPEASNMNGIEVPTIIIRATPYWRAGDNTQGRNLLAGLEHVNRGDRLAIIEDDDYYAPGYLKAVEGWFIGGDLVGEANSLYYHVGTRQYKMCNNFAHASLCSTAMQGSVLATFKRQCESKHKFIDIHLWRECRARKFLARTRYTVGIKGLPGRAGIGSGHRLTGQYKPLDRIIGDDARFYDPFFAG